MDRRWNKNTVSLLSSVTSVIRLPLLLLLLLLLLGIQQSVIDQAIDQWRVRLNACVKAKGKRFEHTL